MHGTNTVKPYERLQELGRRAEEDLDKAEKERNAIDAYHARNLGELTVALSPFCGLDTRCTIEQWNVLERMIHEAVEFPYPLYRPLMKSNLMIIFASLRK